MAEYLSPNHGVRKMGGALSNPASSYIAKTPANVGRSSSSRRHIHGESGGPLESDTEAMNFESCIDNNDAATCENEKASYQNILKKTLKTFKKGATKMNPLRMANSAVKYQHNGSAEATTCSMIEELGGDEAEDAVLSSVERRASTTKAGEDGFRPAVEGEAPPFYVPTLGNAFPGAVGLSRGGESDTKRKTSPSLKLMTQKIMAAQRLERAALMHKKAYEGDRGKSNQHRRARTLLGAIGDVNHDREPEDAFSFHHRDGFHDYHRMFDEDPTELKGSIDDNLLNLSSSMDEDKNDIQYAHEGLPLMGGDSSGRDSTISERQWRARQLLMKSQFKRFQKFLNPSLILSSIFHWFIRSALLVAIPLFVTAWILFYYCGNPLPPEFLPGSATLSWWFNFTGRQLVVFELACVTQFFVIDLLVLQTRIVSRALGSWVTIFFIQSKGWPFIVGSWGLWALLLLQGGSKFDYHWLYFTGIKIYSSGNSGSYIISSEGYLRILLAMVVTGLFSTSRRTLSTLYFGRRMFESYKPRLEEILNDIILISEVAELSVESDNIASVIGVEKKERKYDPPEEINASKKNEITSRANHIRWSSLKFEDAPMSRSGSDKSNFYNAEEDEPTDTASQITDFDGDASEKSAYYDSSSSRIPLKELLDKWQEPVSKKDKTINATVNDILKFRRALTYMDLDYPFSEAFGRASTRDEMILSSEAVYNRLMKLSSHPDILPYSVFQILLLQEDGTEDKEKRKALRNLFRPDGDGNLPILSFVQTCDTIYKKIRYFRASVGNASVIDQVLESIIDVVSYFALGLIVLSMLNLNPWPLLVSMSTLLVTASFAVGPSCAKAIEGILLIVGRRPFDIGDRIVITDSPGATVPSMGSSWFVEDISLFSTTLRFGASNEIATVSNGSIASARITNCARSVNATVQTLLRFHISCHQGRSIEKFRDAIDKYVQDYPNVWDSVLFFRLEDIDPNNEVVTYRLAVRSRFTWQICNRVFQSQAELHKFCISLTSKMGINYDAPNTRSILYFGGTLVDGGVQDYKSNLLQNDNIKNENECLTGQIPKHLAPPVIRGASQKSLDEEEKGPRFVKTAEAARASEQQTQETNDDEKVTQDGAEDPKKILDSASIDSDATGDANQAFLNLLQKSHSIGDNRILDYAGAHKFSKTS